MEKSIFKYKRSNHSIQEVTDFNQYRNFISCLKESSSGTKFDLSCGDGDRKISCEIKLKNEKSGYNYNVDKFEGRVKKSYSYQDSHNPADNFKEIKNNKTKNELDFKKDVLVYITAEAARFKHAQDIVEKELFQCKNSTFFSADLKVVTPTKSGIFYNTYGALRDFFYTVDNSILKNLLFYHTPPHNKNIENDALLHINFNQLIDLVEAKVIDQNNNICKKKSHKSIIDLPLFTTFSFNFDFNTHSLILQDGIVRIILKGEKFTISKIRKSNIRLIEIENG